MIPERTRLTFALLLSVLIHTLLLRLTFGGQGLWLPGFSFPWQDRRIEAPDLRVVLVPAPIAAAAPAVAPVVEPLQQARVEQPVSTVPSLTPSVSGAPAIERPAAARVPETDPRVEARPGTVVKPRTDAATDAAPAEAPLAADSAPPPIPAPAVIASARPDAATWVVPPPQTVMPSPLPDASDAARARIDQQASEEAVRAENARLETERQVAARVEAARVEAARVEAARVEAARVETARIEAGRLEAEGQEAARVEAARLEAERQEVARIEAARVEAARAEAARVEAARVEAARVEVARVEAARVEAARVEAARVEAARVEAARREAERQEAARKAATLEAARAEAEQEDAKREARRQALGRLLNEEADRRDAIAAAARQSPSWSTARRYRLFGRADANAEIVRYAEAWSGKIQMNMTIDMVRQVAKERHTDPLVTVAIRSDGSVEKVTFVTSSGVPAIDEAIRRIVESQAPYPAFPPGLASEYDVIEIRRTWHFDIAVRLY